MATIDPTKLEAVATASAEAYDKALAHIEQEIAARDVTKLQPLIDTLADDGPYAYTLLPEVAADGAVRLPIYTTREEIAEAYGFIRGLSDLHEVIGLTEIRGSWYLFQDNMTKGSAKGSDQINHRETLSLFPSGEGPGITGELVWLRRPRAELGAPDDPDTAPDDPLQARYDVHQRFARYLDGLRANDRDEILAELHPGVASAVRDYVADTGTLVELTGLHAHDEWYHALFDRYEVLAVQPLYQVTQDWYVFAELRLTVRPKDGSPVLVFHTAEFHVVARDGRFIARIGHGTEPVAGG